MKRHDLWVEYDGNELAEHHGYCLRCLVQRAGILLVIAATLAWRLL